MKNLFFAIAIFFPSLVMAQTGDTFTITGKAGNLNAPAKVYLTYMSGDDDITDSSAIVNGAFKFEGKLPGPSTATLLLDKKGGFKRYIEENFSDGRPSKTADVFRFFIEKGNINISTPDSISKAVITGSKLNDEDKELNNKLKAAQGNHQQIMKDFAKTHPDSFISLLLMINFVQSSPDDAELTPMFNALAPSLRESGTGVFVKRLLDARQRTLVGITAPEFTQADTSGKPIALSSFRGKYVLIDFWASWCGPCRAENPNVVAAYNKYKDKNFAVLGVSLDSESGKNAWLQAIKADGLPWTQVSDLKYWQNEAAVLYGVKSIPQNFLVDPAGKIIAKNLRGAELEAKLAELLAL